MGPSGQNEPNFHVGIIWGLDSINISLEAIWPDTSNFRPFINLLHSRVQIYIRQQHLGPLIKVLTSKLK